MKEKTKEALRFIGKIIAHTISTVGWVKMFELVFKAKFNYDKNDERYGKVLIDFNQYGELNMELTLFGICLLFILGYSVYDIRRFIKKEFY